MPPHHFKPIILDTEEPVCRQYRRTNKGMSLIRDDWQSQLACGKLRFRTAAGLVHLYWIRWGQTFPYTAHLWRCGWELQLLQLLLLGTGEASLKLTDISYQVWEWFNAQKFCWDENSNITRLDGLSGFFVGLAWATINLLDPDEFAGSWRFNWDDSRQQLERQSQRPPCVGCSWSH